MSYHQYDPETKRRALELREFLRLGGSLSLGWDEARNQMIVAITSGENTLTLDISSEAIALQPTSILDTISQIFSRKGVPQKPREEYFKALNHIPGSWDSMALPNFQVSSGIIKAGGV